MSSSECVVPPSPDTTRPLLLLTTGGTIANVPMPDGTTAPHLSGAELARFLPTDPEELVVEEWAAAPSWSFGPEEMHSIALRIRDAARAESYAGVIVTHGTTTMEYTAFLTDLFLDAQIPVVFTGAMWAWDAPQPDGPANLHNAACFARDQRGGELGAVVCFDGKIYSARGAYKYHRHSSDAFEDLEGLVGEFTLSDLVLHRVPLRPYHFGGAIEPSVALVKAYPGADGSVLQAAVGAGAQGLVIEGLPGVGGVPPAMQSAVERHAGDIPIVISSRAPRGRLPFPAAGGTGSPLADLGLLSAGTLTTEKAWILLMVCIGEAGTTEEVGRLFHEVSYAGGKEET